MVHFICNSAYFENLYLGSAWILLNNISYHCKKIPYLKNQIHARLSISPGISPRCQFVGDLPVCKVCSERQYILNYAYVHQFTKLNYNYDAWQFLQYIMSPTNGSVVR